MTNDFTRDMTSSDRKPLTLTRLREMHADREPIAMLTCYDATCAKVLNEAGIDCLLVGDSLGMVLQGHTSTIPVTLEHAIYHTQCVARGNATAWLIGDLPFGSYGEGIEQALNSSAALMRAGAQMVKLEGGGWTTDSVRALTERGIPVCAHLGLTPQSVHALGGYRVQGRTESAAEQLMRQARELSDAGASMLVLELVPSSLAAEVQKAVPHVMTIGIGAGQATSGQVLVLHDMIGLTRGKLPRFVENFMASADSIEAAVRSYVHAVKERTFPDIERHAY